METQGAESPRIVHRECGGFLALPGPREGIRIGVTAASEAEARERYAATRARALEILASPVAGEASSATGSDAAS